jgi:hypothetical protein
VRIDNVGIIPTARSARLRCRRRWKPHLMRPSGTTPTIWSKRDDNERRHSDQLVASRGTFSRVHGARQAGPGSRRPCVRLLIAGGHDYDLPWSGIWRVLDGDEWPMTARSPACPVESFWPTGVRLKVVLVITNLALFSVEIEPKCCARTASDTDLRTLFEAIFLDLRRGSI